MSHEQTLNHQIDFDTIVQAAKEASNLWCDPKDGSLWTTRNSTPVSWPRLLHIRMEVSADNEHIKVAGKVRCKKVSIPRPCSRNFSTTHLVHPWVYHLDDALKASKAPDIEQAFLHADRQVATKGKHKGKPFISPRKVAEKLGVDISLVPVLRKDGISWMPRQASGCRSGQKRKPIVQAFKNGYYGRNKELFWLESEVDEFAKARKDLPEKPPNGFVTIKDADKNGDIGERLAHEKCRKKELGFQVVPLKHKEKVNGKREFIFTSLHRIVPQAQLNAHRTSRLVSPMPPDTITVQELARVLKRSVDFVYAMIYRGTKHLSGAKLRTTKGKVLCHFKLAGRNASALRDGCYYVLKSDGKLVWESMYPSRPWPLEKPIAVEPASGQHEPAKTTNFGGRQPASRQHESAKTTNFGGRPADPEVARRKRELVEAWDRGEHASKAAAARAHGLHRSDASKIIDEHERRKRRKTQS